MLILDTFSPQWGQSKSDLGRIVPFLGLVSISIKHSQGAVFLLPIALCTVFTQRVYKYLIVFCGWLIVKSPLILFIYSSYHLVHHVSYIYVSRKRANIILMMFSIDFRRKCLWFVFIILMGNSAQLHFYLGII